MGDFYNYLNTYIKGYKVKSNKTDNGIADLLVVRYKGKVDNFGKTTVNKIVKGTYKNFTIEQVTALADFFGIPDLIAKFKVQQEGCHEKVETADMHEEISIPSCNLPVSALSDYLERYVDYDSPLLVLCDQNSVVKYLLKKRNITYYDAGATLNEDDADKIPYELIYCHITASPMSQEVSELFSKAILLMRTAAEHNRDKHVIMAVESRNYGDIDKAHEIYGKQHYTCKFSMDKDFWLNWLPTVKNYIDIELRGFIYDALKNKDRFFITNWERTFEIVQKTVDVMTPTLYKSKKEKLMRIAETEIWREFYALADYIIKQIPGDKGKLIKEAQKHSCLVDADIQKRFVNGYKKLESFGKRPEGFTSCDHSAYLYALEEINNILDVALFWSDDYKQEIRSWLRYGNVENMPSIKNEEWALLLNKQYKKHAEYLNTIKHDPEVYNVWKYFCKNGFPSNWFDDDCKNMSILMALAAYFALKRDVAGIIEKNGSKYIDNGMRSLEHHINDIRWHGVDMERSKEEWYEYFNEQLICFSTPFDFDYAIRMKK